MFNKSAAPTRARDEGEKPFWISFADLMTAMMILFLVVMVASLSSVTQRIFDATQEKDGRKSDIKNLCLRMKQQAKTVNKAINVNCKNNRISFGEAGRFADDQYRLEKDGIAALRDVVPLVLQAANSSEGKKWFKQIVIEGFTDTRGSYLYNLNLSLRRSEWVMCSLLQEGSREAMGLTIDQQKSIRALFLAGGVSFNSPKESDSESRRVELRLEFYGLKGEGDSKEESTPALKFEDSREEICRI